MLHRFHTEIAWRYGLAEAVLFYHIAYWVKENTTNDRHLHDSRYWVYDSVHELSVTTHNYLSEHQIRRALNKLVQEEMLIRRNYNKFAYDRTYWYTLSEKAFSILQEIEMDVAKK